MSIDPKKQAFSRRAFIQGGTYLGTGLILTPGTLNLAGSSSGPTSHSGPPEAASGEQAPRVGDGVVGLDADDAADVADAGMLRGAEVLFGLYPGDGGDAVRSAAAKLDFSWLTSGDSVLIKVASNSGNPHPAVTSPAAVKAMVGELKKRGAGRVIVADQAGVEWVRRSARGRYGSTLACWQANGLVGVENDAEVYFFDDQDFDTGYFQATLPSGNHWPRGAWIPKVIKEVDHVVYMPRLGAHQIAGLTMGLKIAVGWLRDDSRHDLHNDARYFHAKYPELSFSDELKSRLRLTVTACDRALLHGGPDSGTVYALDPAMVIASATIANHDALACSTIVTLEREVASTAGVTTYSAATATLENTAFANGALVATGAAGPWLSSAPASPLMVDSFDESVNGCIAVNRAWQLSGGAPTAVHVIADGHPLNAALRDGIEAHGNDLYVFG